ncbi:DUF4236 domain-containing protein [Streptomyces sp. NPDC048419]|uniref:DUF4236 domain-containing protein n=1 Tax=Streptomyces sp. NPDC048419 TaxID=3365547 RepID=UPI00371CB024
MGFSYRKTFKAGPIRITASKSGVSYSAGVKGARVTRRADGKVQTTLSVPGTGLRYTETAGRSRAKPTANTAPPAKLPVQSGPTATELRAAYQKTYTLAVQQLRDGVSGAEVRGHLHNQGLAHPQVLKAVTDAEKYIAGEVKRQARQQAKQQAKAAKEKGLEAENARLDGLAAEAAEQLRTGVAWHLVDKWLKNERGVGFIDRSNVRGRAKKIVKGKA